MIKEILRKIVCINRFVWSNLNFLHARNESGLLVVALASYRHVLWVVVPDFHCKTQARRRAHHPGNRTLS